MNRPSVLFLVALMILPAAVCRAEISEAQAKRAIEKGLQALSVLKIGPRDEYGPLYAYTLVKSGAPATTPQVAQIVQMIRDSIGTDGIYRPVPQQIYTAGTSALLLDAIDGKSYKPELQAITDYLLAQQLPNGSWFYPNQPGQGDTSISQYALLGLWCARRAEISIPARVWDRAAEWFMKTQLANGAFEYHPSGSVRPGQQREVPRPSMGVAGTSSMLLCLRELYPQGFEVEGSEEKKKTGPVGPILRYGGLLEIVDVTEVEGAALVEEADEDKPRLKPGEINKSVNRGLNWLADHIDPRPFTWQYYYLYGLERLAAFGSLEKVGSHDWYQEGAQFLLETQQADGSWKSIKTTQEQEEVATCFAILFLYKATAKSLRDPPKSAPRLGKGLLAGGRGLPKDLTQVQQKDGRIQAMKVDVPVTDLLAQLESTGGAELQEIQEEIIEQVRADQKEELVGQVERLTKLLRSPDPATRQIALWALARSDELTLAPIFINAIKNDTDFDVAMEANNGLCVLSRKLNGVEMPADPLADMREKESEARLKEITKQWRAETAARWQRWYLSVRPYRERDDLQDHPQ